MYCITDNKSPEKEFDFKSSSYVLLQKSVMYINGIFLVQF